MKKLDLVITTYPSPLTGIILSERAIAYIMHILYIESELRNYFPYRVYAEFFLGFRGSRFFRLFLVHKYAVYIGPFTRNILCAKMVSF